MIILMNAIAKGGHDRMIEDAISMGSGHIQIHEKGFWENQSIDFAFILDTRVIKALENNSNISAHAPRIQAPVLLSSSHGTAGALLVGIKPEDERNISILHSKILPGGNFLKQNDRGKAIIGERLAKNLNVKTGNAISFISQGFDGSITAEKLLVAGIIKTGSPEYDKMLMLVHIDDAKAAFSMGEHIHIIAIKLSNPDRMSETISELKLAAGDAALEIMGWDELMPVLVQFIVMDDVSGWIFDFILLMLVAFGILNTIQMSVFERTREFGIMLAVGTKPSQVVTMVMVESAVISFIGVVFGIILGYMVSYYFNIHPIDYSSYSEELAVWNISTTVFPATVTGLNLIVTATCTFFFSILFSIFPARRASRLKPVEAIRHL
jgi:ABC-type lipoprotein release transport system permease subunit